MAHEFYIAKRMKLSTNAAKQGSPSLQVALVGIVLAIVIMILSIVIVTGFKGEIVGKIYNLDAQLAVTNAVLGIDENYSTVNGREVIGAMQDNPNFMQRVASASLIADQPVVLKTENDFMGIRYRGIDSGYDFTYLDKALIEGAIPNVSDTAISNEIIISSYVANRLQLHAGDKVPAYFIDNTLKVRNLQIAGVFSTDLEAFDHAYVLGNIRLVQQINGWNDDTGSLVAVNMKKNDALDNDAYDLYTLLAAATVQHEGATLYAVSTTQQRNSAYFAWLNMLDMNVVIILALMIVVAAFTLISAMLMIVLERIRFIGMFKAMGATNGSIRRIFIYLTGKLIIKALVLGNIIGIGLALLQQHFHIIKLDPSTYYMSYVPIHISIPALLLLNAGIVVVSYLTLLGASHIISTIKPTATMRFE